MKKRTKKTAKQTKGTKAAVKPKAQRKPAADAKPKRFPASSPPIPGSSGEAYDARGDVPAPSRKLAGPPVEAPGRAGYLPARAA